MKGFGEIFNPCADTYSWSSRGTKQVMNFWKLHGVYFLEKYDWLYELLAFA